MRLFNKIKRLIDRFRFIFLRLIGIKVSIYDSPIGDDYHGVKAKIYDAHRSESIYWRNEDLSLIYFLNKACNDGSKVLDAPFGTGRFLKFYSQFNLSVTAIDSSQDMIDVAFEKHPAEMKDVKVMIQKLKSIPVQENFFDAIVCYRFIPWIISLREANLVMAEFSRVCSKYLIVELCVGTHATRLSVPDLNKTMWNKFNYDEIIQWLDSFKFRVIEHKLIYDDEEHPGLTVFFCEKSN